jgi:glutamate/tyrosine decarboxylase-like PLP-dependent enzyme
MKKLLVETADRAARYIAGITDRRVAPLPADVARLEALGGPLPQLPSDPSEVLALLDDIASPATVATTGGRYFGFVIGGSLPAALGANWLAGAWDQNASMQVMSPVAAKLEEIVLEWIVDVLGLPSGSGAGFVTGTTMANFTALAAARTALLKRAGWDVEEDGLFGAPPIHVVVSDEVHVSVLKALSMLGLGRSRVTRVPVDDQGRIRLDALPPLDDQTLVCVQAGNVNTGAFDPAGEICARAHEAGSWVHVDGAFGLWAAVSSLYAPLLAGAGSADSWAIDCHKRLNVPYDSGIAVVRTPENLHTAMTLSAAYLTPSDGRGALALCAGSVAAGPRGRVVGRDALTRTQRVAGNDRAKLPTGESVRGTSAQGQVRYLEQRGPKPGASLVRQRRGHAEGHHRYPERWDLLVWGERSGTSIRRCESACPVGLLPMRMSSGA